MSKVFVVIAFIAISAQTIQETQAFDVPCNLQWKQVDFTSHVGSDWVDLDLKAGVRDDSQFIFRVKNDGIEEEENSYNLGTVTPSFDPNVNFYKSSIAQLDSSLYEEMTSPIHTYEILTNPYSCKLKWERCKASNVKSGMPPMYTKISADQEEFVGKFWDSVDEKDAIVAVNDDTREIFAGEGLRCLKPTAVVNLNMTQFKLAYPSGSRQTELLGFDAIDNAAEVKVAQIINHRKYTAETFEFTQPQPWNFLDSYNLKILLDINQKSIALDNSHIVRLNGKPGNVKEFRLMRESISSRRIDVPPLQAIQACSTLTVDKNKHMQYTAQGRFFAPGVAVSSLEWSVRQLGYTDLRMEGSYVVAQMEGTLVESMGGGSAFFSSPTEGGITCGALAEKIRERNRLESIPIKTQRTEKELEELEENIQRIIKGLSGLQQ